MVPGAGLEPIFNAHFWEMDSILDSIKKSHSLAFFAIFIKKNFWQYG